MGARAIGASVALAALILDQASKFAILRGLGMQDHEKILVAPFLDFELLRNPGISFSLFAQDTAAGRWTLLALTLAATAALCVWLWRVSTVPAAIALGAIVGGALGNGVDRFAYDSVVDFLAFHLGDWHWYVFNVADAAITLGVALLLLDGLFSGRGATRADEARG